MTRATIAAGLCAVMLTGAAAYTTWWFGTPGDCTAIPPTLDAWRVQGIVPDLRGGCAALQAGDVIVAAARQPGEVAYALVEGRAVEPLGRPRLAEAVAASWSFLVLTGALAAVAGYAFIRRRTDPAVPHLMMFAGALLASSSVTLLGLPAAAVDTAWAGLYLAFVVGVYTVAWSALVAFALRLHGPGRGVAAAYGVPLAALAVAAGLVPGRIGDTGWVGGLIAVQITLSIVLVVLMVAVTARRFLGAPDEVGRQQLRVLGAGGWTAAALLLAGWLVPGLLTGSALLPAGWIGLAGLPFVAALTVALLRYRLFALDVVVTRTIVYTALTAAVVTLYLGVVTGLSAFLNTTTSGPVAVVGAAAVALAVNPLRTELQGLVNRLLYGDRDDPYAALRRLGRRLAATAAPAGMLPAAAADVAQALRLPFVAVDLLRDGETVRAATAGSAPTGVELWAEPLVHQGEVLGALVVAPRAPGERPGAAERRLLADLADQIGAAAQVVRLDLDLRRSREQLVLAREEERRALRRALHDEVGPAVAALALRAETVRRMLPPDSAAGAELTGLRRAATAAAGVLRGLAYDLRPPALDELGLVGALREHAVRVAPPGLTITVDAPDGLAELPAAVEVAAFRIAVEAITNVVRHAGASTCTVELRRAVGELHLAVTDDGTGWPDGFRAGVGLTAMRERAHELRGSTTLSPGPRGGAEVLARLPA